LYISQDGLKNILHLRSGKVLRSLGYVFKRRFVHKMSVFREIIGLFPDTDKRKGFFVL